MTNPNNSNSHTKITMPINPKKGVEIALTTTRTIILGLTTTCALTICQPTITINICWRCSLNYENNSIPRNQVGRIIEQMDYTTDQL
ncbi:MAG: hypothetical protein F6K54_13170 [Okeania sp. SIO3B5]|uniref:hypothetical protein n=1 Tax=Okeania sp. SIO3B5 TaxID=2607811 RepID=UPI001400EAE9|nr:hypothetical protein [Okeania sp. SIO3B5]NEO53944.1 hypothetical protein [Okeania sp. SIO3B5]